LLSTLTAGAHVRDARQLVNEAANRAWAPPPTMSVADWADEHRYIDGNRYRTSRTPYVRQVMDCLSPFHPARHIVWEKGVQLGATTVGLNWIGYIIDLAPTSTIITLPSEGVAKEWSNQRLTQLVEETPCLRAKIKDTRSRSGNSIFLKRITGTSATIKIAWSSSAKKLRSTPAANLLSDEVDGFVGDTEGEGCPLVLLDGRFVNFPRGKHFKISTPTHDPSRIHREFLKGDQRYYFVPCPFCGRFQWLDFHRLKYSDGPLGFQCVGCDQRFPERYKTQFLSRGMWVATDRDPDLLKVGFDDPRVLAPILARMDSARRVSFHLPSQYSPIGWYSWSDLVEDWQKAQRSPLELKAVINTKLAEVWTPRGDAPDWQIIYGKREFYDIGIVPAGGLFLTMAVDQQRNPPRLEWELKAWGRNHQSWSVDAGAIAGDPTGAEPWAELDKLIRREWPHASGGRLPVWACAIDTGWNPQRAYDFCSRFPQPAYGPAGAKVRAVRTVVPIKGGHDWQRAIEGFSSIEGARKRDGLRILTLGTPYLKQEVYNALRLPAGDTPYYWHYPNYAEWWFQGLTAESVVTNSAGNRSWVWDKRFRNEPLDLGAYNLAMAELCEIGRFQESDWAELERRVATSTATASTAAQRQAPAVAHREARDSDDDWLRGRGDDWI